MTVRNITIPNHRRLSDKTLLRMNKSELIEYVRVLEHNWSIAVDWNEQQARNFADMLHNMTQIGDDAKRPKDEIAKIIYEELCYMYCDNCRYNSEIGEDDPNFGCDDCHRKYNGWGISMAKAERIAEMIGDDAK